MIDHETLELLASVLATLVRMVEQRICDELGRYVGIHRPADGTARCRPHEKPSASRSCQTRRAPYVRSLSLILSSRASSYRACWPGDRCNQE